MRSFRSGLIAGAAFVAIVPLALSMFLLSRRIESTVRREAEERLDAALGGLTADLQADGARIVEKVDLLARDPLLKRAYLVRTAGSRELSEYLAERRFLLGLDFLQVADTVGVVVADGSTALSTLSPGDAGRHVDLALERGFEGAAIVPVATGEGVALAIGSPIRYEGRVAGVLAGGLVLDGTFLARRKRIGGLELVLLDGAGRPVGSTLGERASADAPFPAGAERIRRGGRSYLARSVPLDVGPAPHVSIVGLVGTAAADQTIAALRTTSLLLGLLGLGIAIALGVIWSGQISRPVERLAAFSRDVAQGRWDEPLHVESVAELETLVEALDRMRRDLSTYRERLVVSERQAAWSQMARRVAHEIKNPLTPIAVSVEDLRRSYAQRREDFPAILDQAVRTIGDEVASMKRLLQEFADFARFPAPRFAPCRVAEIWADLEALYGRDITAARLILSPPDREIEFQADGEQVRQALVNLIKNGLEAIDAGGRVVVSVVADEASVEFLVADTGPGLTEEQRAHLFLPGFTTKTEGSGLGLTIVERIVSEHGGSITVLSPAGAGTRVALRFPTDRKA